MSMVKSSTSPRLVPRRCRLPRRPGEKSLQRSKSLHPCNNRYKRRLQHLHQPLHLSPLKSICLTWDLQSRLLHPKLPLLHKASSQGSLSTSCRAVPVRIPGNSNSNRIRLTYSTCQHLLALHNQLRIQETKTSLTYLLMLPLSQHSSLKQLHRPRCLQV